MFQMNASRRRRAALALGGAIAMSGCATTGGGVRESTLVADVMDAERQWVDAMSGHDFGTLEEIMAGEFRLTFVDTNLPGMPPEAGGPDEPIVVPRHIWLGNLRSMTFGPIEMIEPEVAIHGDRVATVRMRMTLEDWQVDGRVLPPTYDLTDVWVRRDGRWRVINRISEPVQGASGGD